MKTEKNLIIKFDNLLIEYDKQVYYGDGFGEITFKFGNNIIKKSFSINEEENSFSLNGKIEGEVIFYPPKIKWRLGEENWETKPSKPFYFKKITDSTLLEIDKPLDLDCVVELENGRKIEQIKDKQMYKIGQTLHSLTNDSVENVVVYVSSEREKFKVAEIYLKSKILDDFIYVNSEKYEIEYNPEFFIGEDDAILEMRIMNRGNIAFKSELNLKFYNKNKIKLDLNEDRYSISILFAL